jgi:dihydroneopterin aldolase
LRYIGTVFNVFVEGLDLYAYHGVPAEERVVGHRYHVDVSLTVDGRADVTDHVDDTVDYGRVAQMAEALVRETQFHTVERLAAAIADHLIATFALAVEVSVTVRKPFPPAAVIAAAAGATVTRRRGV